MRRSVIWPLTLLLLALVLTGLIGAHPVDSFLFQTPLPDHDAGPGVPPSWVYSDLGGTCSFGQVRVVIPLGFTTEAGAEIFCETISPPVLVGDRSLLPGTELALGVWPVQREWPQPIEIRLQLDEAQVEQAAGRLAFMVYNPSTAAWEEQEFKYQDATSEVVAAVSVLRPVPADFPVWGERTFFGVFWLPQPSVRPSITATRATETATPTSSAAPTATEPLTEIGTAQPALSASTASSATVLSPAPTSASYRSTTPSPTDALLPARSATPQGTVPEMATSTSAASASSPGSPGPIRFPSCAAAISLVLLSPFLLLVAGPRGRS
jgi:hypothetical protein